MPFNTPTSPHQLAPTSITRVMVLVMLALIPGISAYVWFFGWGVVVNICIALVTALSCEALILKLRQRPVLPSLGDGSAALTAILIALTLPPLSPWWITVIGVAFAIIIAKQLYGGLGYNPFNPAMIGYVMLLISFPREMTSWIPPSALADNSLDFLETAMFILFHTLPDGMTFDALTEATPLDSLKTHLALGNSVDEVRAQLGLDEETSRVLSVIPIFGAIGGKGWEWVGGGFLLGGLWLIYKKIISWHIPVAMVGSLFVVSSLFYLVDPEHYATPMFHLFSGAVMLGAFFIATDPVTAAASNRGKIIYGCGIGIFTYVIRTWGGYPDAVAFAVLLLNMCTPLIDHYFKSSVFGHKKG